MFQSYWTPQGYMCPYFFVATAPKELFWQTDPQRSRLDMGALDLCPQSRTALLLAQVWRSLMFMCASPLSLESFATVFGVLRGGPFPIRRSRGRALAWNSHKKQF